MSTEKIIIYGAAAFLAYQFFAKRTLSVSNGRVTGYIPATQGNNQATSNQINARTAIDLAYGIKGLFSGGPGQKIDQLPGGNVGINESLGANESVIDASQLTNSDNWAANPFDSY